MATQAIRRFASLVKAPGFINGAPKSITAASKSLLRTANAGRTTSVNIVSGSAIALPAAKGNGDLYRILVGTTLTSGTIVISCTPLTDFMFGGVLVNDIGDTTAATSDFFPTASTTNTLTLTASIGAGKAGDYIELQDFAAGKWAVSGVIQGETDPTNPFSHV